MKAHPAFISSIVHKNGMKLSTALDIVGWRYTEVGIPKISYSQTDHLRKQYSENASAINDEGVHWTCNPHSK